VTTAVAFSAVVEVDLVVEVDIAQVAVAELPVEVVPEVAVDIVVVVAEELLVVEVAQVAEPEVRPDVEVAQVVELEVLPVVEVAQVVETEVRPDVEVAHVVELEVLPDVDVVPVAGVDIELVPEEMVPAAGVLVAEREVPQLVASVSVGDTVLVAVEDIEVRAVGQEVVVAQKLLHNCPQLAPSLVLFALPTFRPRFLISRTLRA